jgi:hypothetical protein
MASAVGIGQGQRNATQYRPKLPSKGGTDPERLNPQAQDVPDDPIKLAAGWLSCRTCGVAVRIDDEADVITVEISAESAPVSPQNPLRAIEDRDRIQLRFALCTTCRQADELAEQLSGDPATRSPWAWALLGGAMDALCFVPRPALRRPAGELDSVSALLPGAGGGRPA